MLWKNLKPFYDSWSQPSPNLYFAEADLYFEEADLKYRLTYSPTETLLRLLHPLTIKFASALRWHPENEPMKLKLRLRMRNEDDEDENEVAADEEDDDECRYSCRLLEGACQSRRPSLDLQAWGGSDV